MHVGNCRCILCASVVCGIAGMSSYVCVFGPVIVVVLFTLIPVVHRQYSRYMDYILYYPVAFMYMKHDHAACIYDLFSRYDLLDVNKVAYIVGIQISLGKYSPV
jgi:hypothetical protein